MKEYTFENFTPKNRAKSWSDDEVVWLKSAVAHLLKNPDICIKEFVTWCVVIEQHIKGKAIATVYQKVLNEINRAQKTNTRI